MENQKLSYQELELQVAQLKQELENFKKNNPNNDINERTKAEQVLKDNEARFKNMFIGHSNIMLLVEPDSGVILDANPAAVEFYGYSNARLRAMNIEEINIMAPEQVKPERLNALNQKRNYFIFPHKLASGELRTVEVYSSPIDYGGKQVLFSIIHDITERKKVEEALVDHFLKLDIASDAAKMAWWEMDVKTGNVTFNKRKTEMIGYQAEDFKHYSDFTKLVHPDDYSLAMKSMENLMYKKSDKYEVEYRILNSTGEYRWFFDIGSVLKRNENGIPTTVFGAVLDITERKKAEIALIEAKEKAEASEKRFKNYIENAPDGIFVIDNKGTYQDVNTEVCTLFGYSKDEMLGTAKIPLVPVEEYAKARKATELLIANKRNVEEFHFKRKDGSLFYGLMSAVTISENQTLAFIKNIDELKNTQHDLIIAKEKAEANEAKFKAITDQSNDGIGLSDLHGNFVFVNPALCILTGYSEAELLNKTVGDLTAENQTPTFNEIKNSIHGQRFQVSLKRKDGSTFISEIEGRIVNINNTNFVLGTGRDISERIKTEVELLNYKEHLEELVMKRTQELEAANATKDKFFSIIAHDLKNPFAGMIMSCEMLLKQLPVYDKIKIEKKVQSIYSSTKYGYELLSNLLEWSRSQTGNIQYLPQNIDIRNIAEQSIQIVQPQADYKNIGIVSNLMDNLMVNADENLLKTVFRNLITNAIKFTPAGGFIIVAAIKNEGFVEVSISDTGVGISKENLQKLFKVETKASTKGTSNESGTGLGLILCKEFIEKHGGKIWVESKEGKGSTFIFTLPL